MNKRIQKRLAILVLLVAMPLYIAAAWWLLTWIDDRFGRPHIIVELLIYIVAGIIWIVPFRRIFRGVGHGE
ncbi:MAG: DUF2842 domain-containing protein [Paracoccus sp. (in: a-proteobacteria)]|nr:DUF2842 domain-containing protein [Paracoccus sp. (in: a-proteobacteria)]